MDSILMEDDDYKCCLIYSAFLGDTQTTAGLLFSGPWPMNSIDKALLFASAFNHVDTVKELLKDGRASPLALNGQAIKNAALQDNREVVSLIVKQCPLAAALARPALHFVAHMDQVEILKILARLDPSGVFTDTILIAALRSKSKQTLHFILTNGTWQIGSYALNVALEREDAREYIPWMLDKGAKVESWLYTKCKSHLDSYETTQAIKKARIKQLWKKAKAVLLINSFWRHWIMDYYSPGNDTYPEGKGFTESHRRFMEDIENERIVTSQMKYYS